MRDELARERRDRARADADVGALVLVRDADVDLHVAALREGRALARRAAHDLAQRDLPRELLLRDGSDARDARGDLACAREAAAERFELLDLHLARAHRSELLRRRHER